ncbi:MAG: BTAD domain-containing putative transcriptional regulator [Clostridia bacterium]|nr:BTAD domain-containing putative transcriptional regulator [Clostridia bacterium]MDR3645510.1 BTAD domain-containing putative transcriptional regulator [Clostridia bacterium]
MPEVQIEKASLIEIAMFGGFSIQTAGEALTDSAGRTKQLWTLLEYLIANRLNDISQEKLIEILWEDEACSDPANALKNLVYRLRSLLKMLGGENSPEFILFKRNNYCWNNALHCAIDTEEFEKSFRAAKAGGLSDEERMSRYLRAVELYKGDFLPKSSSQDWVISRSTYYRNIFIECVKGVCELLIQFKHFEEAEMICQKALSIEPFDESLHALVINLYLAAGSRQKAVAYYEYASEMFYEKLGVKFSDPIRSLMRGVTKTVNGVEKDMDIIEDGLRESGEINCAYFCNYEVFKSIYRIEARMAERFGQSVFVVLLTLEADGGVEKQDVLDAMQVLKSIILKNLRKSDVVSRFSNTQFILMLPALTFENGKLVLNRIVRKYNEECRRRSIRLNTRLNPLKPVEQR